MMRWEAKVARATPPRSSSSTTACGSWHADRYPFAADADDRRAERLGAGPAGPSRSTGRPIRTARCASAISARSPRTCRSRCCSRRWRLARSHPLLAGAELNIHGHLGFFPARCGAAASPACDAEADAGRASTAARSPRPTRPACTRESDALVFCVPGAKYVTSGKVFEYMATGKPIVSVHEPDIAAADVLDGYPLWFTGATASTRTASPSRSSPPPRRARDASPRAAGGRPPARRQIPAGSCWTPLEARLRAGLVRPADPGVAVVSTVATGCPRASCVTPRLPAPSGCGTSDLAEPACSVRAVLPEAEHEDASSTPGSGCARCSTSRRDLPFRRIGASLALRRARRLVGMARSLTAAGRCWRWTERRSPAGSSRISRSIHRQAVRAGVQGHPAVDAGAQGPPVPPGPSTWPAPTGSWPPTRPRMPLGWRLARRYPGTHARSPGRKPTAARPQAVQRRRARSARRSARTSTTRFAARRRRTACRARRPAPAGGQLRPGVAQPAGSGTSWFQPSTSVSTHSVSLRSVVHGRPSR